MEAMGVVIGVGPELTGRQVGDVVTYGRALIGAYDEQQIIPAESVVSVPSYIGPNVADSKKKG
ncbi:Alcohol dehydrogenase, C-terminal [Artemisia annua]|uniref:Alcohol dehydrogenase, C-terminal n=1 Tax=Artemisia annua TaxID=35608 RepID=A0A2U1M1W3_ARTAN|nr:Alcohol dehydrogenase, C-terminal [Artemisia annua]